MSLCSAAQFLTGQKPGAGGAASITQSPSSPSRCPSSRCRLPLPLPQAVLPKATGILRAQPGQVWWLRGVIQLLVAVCEPGCRLQGSIELGKLDELLIVVGVQPAAVQLLEALLHGGKGGADAAVVGQAEQGEGQACRRGASGRMGPRVGA